MDLLYLLPPLYRTTCYTRWTTTESSYIIEVHQSQDASVTFRFSIN